MGSVSKFTLAAALVGAVAAFSALPAQAGCKRMAFSVNDYGKDGPTKDSQDLLDKHIATWAAEQGIDKFTVGKKDVTCELYLNLIVVDEHTCTARATVCWGGDKLPASAQQAKSAPAGAPEKAAEAAKPGTAGAPAETTKPAAGADAKATDTKAAGAKPADAKAADTKPAGAKAADAHPTTANAPAAPVAAPVETGALPLTNKAHEGAATTAAASQRSAKPSADDYSVSERDALATAAAAAERAAEAAERAAAAAERAAAALNEHTAAEAAKTQAVQAPPVETPAFVAPAAPVVAPVQPVPPTTKP
jgi:hypothetical protein